MASANTAMFGFQMKQSILTGTIIAQVQKGEKMAKMSIPILVDWESIKDYLAKSDIVEVVRCKDCKQCRKTILFGHFATVCDYWIKLTDDDGYCNHAERKEE